MSESAGDANTGCSVQNSIDFSAMATFERLEKLREYAKKLKDENKPAKPYDYDDNHPKSGRLDTQLFPNRNLQED